MIEKQIIEDQKQTIHRLQQECTEKMDIIEALSNKNKELQDKLNEYEKYGGVIDEGRAWADEAIESREKLRIASVALQDISQHSIDDCPYCEEKILKATNTLEILKD